MGRLGVRQLEAIETGLVGVSEVAIGHGGDLNTVTFAGVIEVRQGA